MQPVQMPLDHSADLAIAQSTVVPELIFAHGPIISSAILEIR
jgi:hypothetical protein